MTKIITKTEKKYLELCLIPNGMMSVTFFIKVEHLNLYKNGFNSVLYTQKSVKLKFAFIIQT